VQEHNAAEKLPTAAGQTWLLECRGRNLSLDPWTGLFVDLHFWLLMLVAGGVVGQVWAAARI
jgi:hypothetical protein